MKDATWNASRFAMAGATPCYNGPAPAPPREPLRLSANFVDRTAEKVSTVIGIVGATGAGKGTKPG